ncbi:MFS transporter [Peribacillus saganii]|uniref:MFS transporter n=1 Tax=Peribacillus saganii TaxID=2303992 RepID=A0A372LQH8_9BACI|nr:MFS transporter [Peribacillus saganii]RFU69815.1 MFS transporter [Peribacillus saganii]
MASIPLVMTLGNSMLIPVLPIFEEKVGITSFQTSLVITSYSIASIFLIPVAGYLSDRVGRKKIILPGLILALLGGLIAGYASWKIEDPFTWIIIGRILQGVGASGAAPIILPLVGDLYKDDDEKTSSCLGIIETANTFGKVLSPILGSAFAAFLWFLPFFSISIFSLISILLVFFFIKVPKEDDEEPEKFKEFLKKTKKTFKKEGKWLYTVFILGGFAMLVLFAVLFFLSDILEKKHGLHGMKKGFVLAIPLFFLCLSSFITGLKIKGNKKVMKWIVIISLIIMSVFILFMARNTDNLVFLLGLVTMIGIGIGAMLPTLDALITENIEKDERGTISSFYSSARFIGVAAGPPLMSIAKKDFLSVSFIAAAAAGTILIFMVMKLISGKNNKADQAEA